MVPFSLEQKIHQVITGKLSLKDFEQWMYQNEDLASVNPDLYLELISFDYSHEYSLKAFQLSFAKYVGFHKFEADLIKECLYSIINRDGDYIHSIRMLYEFYFIGYEFLQKLGLSYGLWVMHAQTSDSHGDVNDIVESYYPDIVYDTKNALHWLESGNIVFKAEKCDLGGFEYDDLRSEDEKIKGYVITTEI
ncbi:hypothetical protein MN210_01945 [Psychrobacter raelei]|uniref:Uncharacterized protein n=2 Tax=Psychrobacter raelei TaxID=2565531 RepID=A0AAT9PEN6_9GAMM|nr:hypothetical protein [Psychrobacter sp. PraFG1]UNK05656.1 hypothetical protein MN210_01945 [Psychrobacter sp. PraFG1]